MVEDNTNVIGTETRLARLLPSVDDARKELLVLLNDHAVIRATDERLISPNGCPISWLIDTRVVLLNPRSLPLVAVLFWAKMAALMPFQLLAPEITGIPLLSSLQSFGYLLGHDVNGVIVRKHRKASGRRRIYEGVFDNAPIVFIDDLINSGATLRKVSELLKNDKRHISHIFTLIIFDRDRLILQTISRVASIQSVFSVEELGVRLVRHMPRAATATGGDPILRAEQAQRSAISRPPFSREDLQRFASIIGTQLIRRGNEVRLSRAKDEK